MKSFGVVKKKRKKERKTVTFLEVMQFLLCCASTTVLHIQALNTFESYFGLFASMQEFMDSSIFLKKLLVFLAKLPCPSLLRYDVNKPTVIRMRCTRGAQNQ